MNQTYSVTLNLETAITTSVIANNEEEAEQIALNNFYNQNIKEVQKIADSEFLTHFVYSMYLSENDDAVRVEEEK